MIKYIDLFAGLGGIRLGFKQALDELGIESECVFSSEIKPYAIKAYKGFYGEDEKIFGDITIADTKADIPNFDFLLAGFPCQPFSTAGNGDGFADTRGTMFFEIERILKDKIEQKHPAKGFLLENVEGLVNHDGGKTLKTIISHLKKLGYKVNYKLLDSQYFGLPQSRKRVYIVGTLTEEISLDDFNVSQKKLKDILEHGQPTVQSNFTNKLLQYYKISELPGCSIKDKRGGKKNIHSWDIDLKGQTSAEEKELLNCLLKERRKKHWAEEIGIKWMDGMPLTEKQIATFYSNDNLGTMLNHLKDLGYIVLEHPKKQIKNANGTTRREEDTTKPKGYNIVAGKLSFEFSKILDPKELAPTLVAMDVSKLGVVDGNGIRRLTIRECQRICGYPDEYDLTNIEVEEAYDLLGNTVCVPVIKQISDRIANYCLQRGEI